MIGRDLRTIREACGVTMGELADALEWKLTALSDKEREVSPLSDSHVAEVVAVLARVVRARTPVKVIDLGAPRVPARGNAPTAGLDMMRILATGQRTTAALALEMKRPSYMVPTLALRHVVTGRVAVIGTARSNGGPPQNVYAITDAGRTYLAAWSTL